VSPESKQLHNDNNNYRPNNTRTIYNTAFIFRPPDHFSLEYSVIFSVLLTTKRKRKADGQTQKDLKVVGRPAGHIQAVSETSRTSRQHWRCSASCS